MKVSTLIFYILLNQNYHFREKVGFQLVCFCYSTHLKYNIQSVFRNVNVTIIIQCGNKIATFQVEVCAEKAY